MSNGSSITDNRNEIFGKAIQTARLAKGWSLREFEEISGVDHTSVNRIESGDRGYIPHQKTVVKLCVAAGMDSNAWYRWLKKPTPIAPNGEKLGLKKAATSLVEIIGGGSIMAFVDQTGKVFLTILDPSRVTVTFVNNNRKPKVSAKRIKQHAR